MRVIILLLAMCTCAPSTSTLSPVVHTMPQHKLLPPLDDHRPTVTQERLA